MTELAALIKKRGSLKARLTHFNNFLEKKEEQTVLSKTAIIEIVERTSSFKDILSNFDEIQGQIESICENPEQQLEERDFFETFYFELLSRAKSLEERDKDDSVHSIISGHSGSSRHSGSAVDVRKNIKLPVINLTKFSGDLNKFQEFHDTYLSLVHDNSNLSDIERFHYLRSVLEGEALEVLHSIPFSAANYRNAWELLCERFLNKQLLAHNNIKLILNLPSMQKEVYSQMREIQDGLAKQLKSLRSLNLNETQLFESLIIFIISSKLDPRTVRDWEAQQGRDDEFPTLIKFQQFLKEKCNLLEILSLKADHGTKTKRSNCMVTSNNLMSCFHCKDNHSIYNCEEFKKLSAAERVLSMKNEKRCLNCLRRGHYADKCTSRGCKMCKGRHHSLLHENKEQKRTRENLIQSSSPTVPSQMSMCTSGSMNILLATALVKVIDAKGSEHQCRVLLDSGSQSNLVSSRLVKRLNIATNKTNIFLTGVGQVNQQVNSTCKIEVKAEHGKFRSPITCLVVENVCGEIPSYPIDINKVVIPEGLSLADPTFNSPGDIDMLLGAQWFWNLMCVGRITLNNEGLIVQKTKLGWVISGPVAHERQLISSCNLNLTSTDIQNQLEKFWTIESCEMSTEIFPEIEEHFKKSTIRTETGRFMVAVPLKEPYESLGSSYDSAKRRFTSLERKLENNPMLKSLYNSFMKEYEEMGHMSEDCSNQIEGYYVPHHGILNEKSSTTKLRVVFDASMVTSSGKSLNHIQIVGDPIQNELFTILLRFRRHAYAVCADVEKMYRQVLVRHEDRKYQKILWRSESTQPLKTYLLNTVTYGTAAAPFLATRALHEMGNICRKNQPKVADVIQHDFYVDDMLSGADSIYEAIELAKDVSQVLSEGCFPLRKWRSNSIEILQALSKNKATKDPHEISSKEDAKTLGLIWNQHSDEFLYRTDIIQTPKTSTKRSVLSAIAKIFDPLGCLSPITITAKIILQQIWLDKLSWDEDLPQKTLALWRTFCYNFSTVSEIKVPRYVLCKDYSILHLHGFSDASEKAYGACIYAVAISPNETTSILLCAKTRVAPLKAISIPRLELCAAQLLSRLADRVIKELNLNFGSVNLWSDSSIVLSWLSTPPYALKTFVRNRVGDVQELTKTAKWRHISSTENPADLLSRGTNPASLKENPLWWNGPNWLTKSEDQWPKQHCKKDNQPIPDLRKQTVLVSVKIQLPIEISRFSNFSRLQRAFAFCKRFIRNCQTKSKEDRKRGPLTLDELKDSLLTLIKFAQQECFANDIKTLEQQGIVLRKSSILDLNPFMEDGLIRVGGRLHLSSFLHNKKHPILLPKRHHLTKLIFKQEHIRLGHAGPEQLLASIRDNYWPISGRNMAKEVFRKCIHCFRVKPQAEMPIMGNLPSARLSQTYPFINTGIDYAGPILIKNKLGRGSKLSKAYIALFICLTTRAIHLEVVTNLTTEAFMAAFKRFIARRGRPNHVYSDNGTNFVGARRELNELSNFLAKNQGTICEAGTSENVTFHFIPPRSPHFGGLWEAGVKCTKTHMKRIMGNAHLTFEGLYTVLTQIEAILNSRPLTPLSSNPVDMESLTPAHFLIGRKLTSLPEYNLETSSISRLSMFERAQQMAQHFWRRWSKEYISQLQQRQRWKTSSSNVKKDTLVLIKEDNLPPIQWKLGRIVELHPGRDGVVRIVSVKCGESVLKRPCVKICPLPQEEAQ